ncbi:M20 family metallopeptidase [Bacilliculturomica massiliensis]|uniref:M20 family metallopeptidase n=1 Tax=Bacilliculturomica massiliensis TaxID=1917867 RepID=UPI0013EEFBDC|nr:M20 family metallopeptidase [Bacilliculturomica massiliensis]
MVCQDYSEKLKPLIDREELAEMTGDLVRIPSYAGIKNQETEVARYIKSIFDREGIECRLDEVQDGRCNVTARMIGTGGGKTLLFNGHMDTVEPNGMEKAFEPEIRDGNLYGRGAADMKGPLAAMIGAMLALKRAGIQLKGDVIFTGVLDEEHNSIGTIDLIEKGIKADGAIVGEPTGLQVCTAHRGLEWYRFQFIGKTVHGGRQKEGINAIAKAVRFINALEEELIPKIYARKHPLLEEATLNYGVIHGGTQLSTVAGECNLYVDRRFLPGENYEEVEGEFREILHRLEREDKDFKCIMSVTEESAMKEGYVHKAMEISADHPLVQAVRQAVKSAVEQDAVMSFFPAWTDGGLLSNYAGIPTVVIGPGEIACCHSNDEHISIKSLEDGCLSYALAAVSFCGVNGEK